MDSGGEDDIPLLVEPQAELSAKPVLEIVQDPCEEEDLKPQSPDNPPGFEELLDLRDEALKSLSGRKDTESSIWSLTLPDNAEAASEVFCKPRWEGLPRQRHLWLWTTALAMTLVALGSMAYTGLLERVRDSVISWVSRPSLAATAPATPAPVASAALRAAAGLEPASEAKQPAPTPKAPPVKPAKPPVAEARPQQPAPVAARPAPVPPPATAPDSTPAQPAPRDEASDVSPSVQVSGKLATLVIPLGGSTDNPDSYMLDDPYALVINLPRARRLVRKGTFRPATGPFRLIWVRERKGGVHLRVFFRGGQPEHKLKIGQREVRVSVSTGQG